MSKTEDGRTVIWQHRDGVFRGYPEWRDLPECSPVETLSIDTDQAELLLRVFEREFAQMKDDAAWTIDGTTLRINGESMHYSPESYYAMATESREITDKLGMALYGELDGLPCWGDHVAVTLAIEAAGMIGNLAKTVESLRGWRDEQPVAVQESLIDLCRSLPGICICGCHSSCAQGFPGLS